MSRAALHDPHAVGGSRYGRRVALAAVGVVGLGLYAVKDRLLWLGDQGPEWAGNEPAAQTGLPIRAAARDIALTIADVAGLPGDLRIVAEHAPAAVGASGAVEGLGSMGTYAVTFRPAGAPVWTVSAVWEPWTWRGASGEGGVSAGGPPAVREVSSTVDVYRDAAAAERAFAVWHERMAGTYRALAYVPWRLSEGAHVADPAVLATYGGVRPHAAIALAGARAANVLASVWVAGQVGEDHEAAWSAGAGADAVGEGEGTWRVPMQQAVGLAETVVTRAMAAPHG